MPAALVCLLPLSQLGSEDLRPLLSAPRRAQLLQWGPAHPQYAQRLGVELALCAALRHWGAPLPPVYGYDALGKPCLQPLADGTQWHMSLSHCPGYAACALGDVPVGVDVELHRTLAPAMARLRSPQEAAAGQAFTPWHYVAKESYLKYLGLGLRLPMAQVTLQGDVAQAPGHPAGQLHTLAADAAHAVLCTLPRTQVETLLLTHADLLALL